MRPIRKGDLVEFVDDPLLDVENHFFFGSESEVYLVLSDPRMRVIGPRELLVVELLSGREVKEVPIGYLKIIEH